MTAKTITFFWKKPTAPTIDHWLLKIWDFIVFDKVLFDFTFGENNEHLCLYNKWHLVLEYFSQHCITKFRTPSYNWCMVDIFLTNIPVIVNCFSGFPCLYCFFQFVINMYVWKKKPSNKDILGGKERFVQYSVFIDLKFRFQFLQLTCTFMWLYACALMKYCKKVILIQLHHYDSLLCNILLLHMPACMSVKHHPERI